jgi:hypothetical protein
LAEEVFAALLHGLLGKPAHHRLDILRGFGRVVGFNDHVAAGNIDFVLEGHDDGLGREGLADLVTAIEITARIQCQAARGSVSSRTTEKERVLPSLEVKIMDKALIFIEKQVYKNGSHFGGEIPKGFEVFLRGHPRLPK